MPKSFSRSSLIDGLQDIAILAADAHEIALDGSLDLELAVLDLLDDLARLFGGDALLQRDLLAHRGPAAGMIGPYSRPLSGTWRLTSLACRISLTAFSLNSSWLASTIFLSFSFSSILECEFFRS